MDVRFNMKEELIDIIADRDHWQKIAAVFCDITVHHPNCGSRKKKECSCGLQDIRDEYYEKLNNKVFKKNN